MRVKTDFLVLGSGIAGLSFALKAAKLGRVFILTKNLTTEGATRYAQGGIAAVFSETDSFESHIQDTLSAGAGLCANKVVELTVREGPERVRELISLGVPFSLKTDSLSSFPYDLAQEGGHQQRRILHADDLTGQAILNTLHEAVRAHPNIKILENHIGIDLITNFKRPLRGVAKASSSKQKCHGLYALNIENNQIHTFSAQFTILATGGAGKAYLYTSNPDTATGDGIAMAARAGARVANMEFMQFHPTCLYHPQAKSFLVSETLRGEGGILVDHDGHAFMESYHEKENLAPRDIVARAIDSQIKKSGHECVYLDMTKQSAAFLQTRFPNIYERCLSFGIDMAKHPIPVVPAAHYTCGGVLSDDCGETTIENLFAIGEVAHTGLHGANRLASNSLLEGVVFAHRAFLKTKERLESKRRSKEDYAPDSLPEWNSGMAVPMEEQINISHTWKEIRTLMWNYVGIVRSTRRLEKALTRLKLIRSEVQEYYWKFLLTSDLIELRNLVTVSELIVNSSLSRKESRGLHYNLDYPQRDDKYFKRDTIL